MELFKKCIILIASALCVAAMTTHALANPKGKTKKNDKKGKDNSSVVGAIETVISGLGGDDGNNGHGNDPSGSDPSNPGKGKGKDKHAGHDHGKGGKHEGDGFDHPGASDIGSVLDLLGVANNTTPDNDPPTPPSNPVITPPTTTTNNPFSDTLSGGSQSGQSDAGSTDSTVLPFGSVPLIRDDAASVDFLLQKILDDLEAAALQSNETTQLTPKIKAAHKEYAKKLTSTLSALTAEQQNYVFYGRKK